MNISRRIHLTLITVFLIMGAIILPVGCQTMKARKVQTSGFLSDYSQLSSGGTGEAQLRYINPNVDFKAYDKVMVDAVTILLDEDSKLSKAPKEDVQALVNYLEAVVREQLEKDYTLVKQAAPGVMRLRIAITDAKSSKPVMNTVSTVIPISLAVSTIKKIATDTPLAVGSAGIEAEAIDTQTQERLFAAVDRQVGTKMPGIRQFDKWNHVKDAYDLWSERLITKLRELRTR